MYLRKCKKNFLKRLTNFPIEKYLYVISGKARKSDKNKRLLFYSSSSLSLLTRESDPFLGEKKGIQLSRKKKKNIFFILSTT